MVKNMVEKYTKSIDSVQKVNQNYLNITNAPLKCIEKYEPILPPKPDTRYIGRISTTQQNLPVIGKKLSTKNLKYSFLSI